MTSLIERVCSKSPISTVELIYVEEELPTYGLVIPMSAFSPIADIVPRSSEIKTGAPSERC
jgi:hypothetical protein